MKTPSYTPSPLVLERYAKVMVRFALNGGKGIKKGDTVYLVGNDSTKPLFMAVRREILKAGGNIIANYLPTEFDGHHYNRDVFELASPAQLDWFPKKYMRGLIDEIDHMVYLFGDENPHALEGIDPKKIMQRGIANKPYKDWRDEKEQRGAFTWTLCLYGTEGMAKEAGLSLKEYWGEIIKACYLDTRDPIAEYKRIAKIQAGVKKKLNALTPRIKALHIEGEDADLWITIGKDRQWLGGGGRNIPSFEIFTSPDCRHTKGWIRFNCPLYRYGNLIEGIELWFENGKVVKSKATKNEKVLKAMIDTEGAAMVGEFSLTDKRVSRITKFMAETLFDENIGGPFGNTHIALGSAYKDCYTKNPTKVSKNGWKMLGFNDSSVHTDIISTTNRTVTAHLKNGTTKVIYEKGMFVV